VVVAAVALGFGTAAAAPVSAGGLAVPNQRSITSSLRERMRSLALRPPTSSASALAAPVPRITVSDGIGDSEMAQGDLTGVGMAQTAGGTSLAVKVYDPVDPSIDYNWLLDQAAILWQIDTNLDDFADYAVIMEEPAGYPLTVGVFTIDQSTGDLDQVLCEGTPVYVANSGYRAVVRAGCLPRMTSVRFRAGMLYSNYPINAATPIDIAPDYGMSPTTNVQTTVAVKAHSSGYWMLGADGRVYAFGGATGFSGTVSFATAMAPRSDGKGYWVVDAAGHVYAYGSAGYHGGAPALGAGEIVSTISATPNGGGYWLFSNKGRTFAYGNASSYGDMSGTPLNGPVVASVATPTGHGYYMVGSDGGIFSFGDARFHGSTGNLRLNKPVVGIAPTPDNKGYWLVASDGGVFAFSAPFRGSMGGTRLAQPVDGLVAYGNGYLMGAADGGVFDFSNKVFAGSIPSSGQTPSAPIIGIAAFST
jgi:hypothetical protein